MRTTLSPVQAAVTARDVSTLTWLLSLVHPDEDAAVRIRQLGDDLERIHAKQHVAWNELPDQYRDEALDALAEQEHETRRQLRHTAGLP